MAVSPPPSGNDANDPLDLPIPDVSTRVTRPNTFQLKRSDDTRIEKKFKHYQLQKILNAESFTVGPTTRKENPPTSRMPDFSSAGAFTSSEESFRSKATIPAGSSSMGSGCEPCGRIAARDLTPSARQPARHIARAVPAKTVSTKRTMIIGIPSR